MIEKQRASYEERQAFFNAASDQFTTMLRDWISQRVSDDPPRSVSLQLGDSRLEITLTTHKVQ